MPVLERTHPNPIGSEIRGLAQRRLNRQQGAHIVCHEQGRQPLLLTCAHFVQPRHQLVLGQVEQLAVLGFSDIYEMGDELE